MGAIAQPNERRSFDAQHLMRDFPPQIQSPNKRVVYDIACPPGASHAGEIGYTRWRAMPLPPSVLAAAILERAERREGFYDYAAVEIAGALEWHVNFADPHLFVAYGSGLFAQDEMQVAEHPALGALRESLEQTGATALTVERGVPTPILVTGVERRCRVETSVNSREGRPRGLYGNAFSAAREDVVARATTRIEPPSITNLIAMAAPSPQWGRYTLAQIEQILTTAYTGFRAATLESSGAPAVIHTGFWGCGAFGGNRRLMSMCQLLAAGMAGVARLVFHTGDSSGSVAFDFACRSIERELGREPIATDDLVVRIAAMGFEWGVSDGN